MKTRIFVKDTQSSDPKDLNDFCAAFTNELRVQGLEENVQVVRVADIGVYYEGMVVKILPSDILYRKVQAKDIPRIIEESVRNNRVIDELVAPAVSRQMRIVLRHCGVVDPDSIEDAITHDGYAAIAKILSTMSPEQVIEEMKTSGLRGRGGAGFPTWLKWKLGRETPADQKFIICNGDEGDPGAYMDRSVLEGDPHSVIEGMMIAAYVVGATKGYFYIRAEYPLATERIERAIGQAYAHGLLGKNILGSPFSFDIDVRLGAGAFVCGEATALIASIEGKRGYPRPRPPYPTVQGLWGKPTVINNVETLANISPIILRGGKWFAGIGTETSKGTKVFAVTGKVRNSGLVEVPMGTTLKDIVFDIGGGILDDRKIKAVQTGGPSGGVIPEDFLDIPVGYENLQRLGSIMGSGGMIVMDETDCVVDIAKFYLGFCVDESCGKCAPCRIGGTQLLNLLNKISEGRSEMDDLDKLKQISLAMQKASLCGLGQTAANPVLSTMQYFEEEYRTHVQNQKCPSGKCAKLLRYDIDPAACKRCSLCSRHCPVHAISGSKTEAYVIHQEQCIRCGRCFEVCKFDAVTKK